jgi:hypothetical protein
VRCDKAHAAAFAFRQSWAEGDVVRGITEPMAVPAMHAAAEQIRKEGCGVFFAAAEE